MPLRRAALPAAPAPEPHDAETSLRALNDSDADVRRRAASALGEHAAGGAAPAVLDALAARLPLERDGAVREALFAACRQIGGAAAAACIAPLVRQDDAALRGGALETLKHLSHGAAPAVDGLLADPDADVRLLAVEVVRHWPPALATPRLAALLDREGHVNVAGAVLDVVTAAGEPALRPAVAALAARFRGEGFIAFASGLAIAALTARAAPPPPPPRSKKPRKTGP